MKRFKVILAVVVFVAGLMLSGCGSSQHACPAYGQLSTDTNVEAGA
jgi:outer membrane murein-binding lipoprotein Lpp